MIPRTPNFRLRDEPIQQLRYKGVKGYSEVEEPNPSILVKGSKNIDTTREIGISAKRFGYELQAPPIGNGGVNGIHSYRSPGGDRILYGVDDKLCMLSGENKTITKSTTADYEAGTKVNTDTSNNEIKALRGGMEIRDVTVTANGSATIIGARVLGQTFKPKRKALSSIKLYFDYDNLFSSGDTVTIKVYDSPSKNTLHGTVTKTATETLISYKFAFDTVIPTPELSYYFEITATGDVGVRLGEYADGHYSVDGSDRTSSIMFELYGTDDAYSKFVWTSPVYDLGATPISSTLTTNKTTPIGSGVIIRARGSNDNQYWGDWQVVTNTTPLTRYVQVEYEGTTNGAVTASVQDFTITYITAFSQSTVLKSGLSGNTVSMVDYKCVCHVAEGGRPFRIEGTTVKTLGVDPPTGAPTLTGTAGTAKHQACYTYVNEYGAESNPSPVTGEVTADATPDLNWSNIGIGPAGTTARKLYRTRDLNGAEKGFFYVTTIFNNTTTTYTDTTADENLVVPLETDNNIPPNASIIHEHKGYMMYVLGNKLYFSKVNTPDCVPDTAYKEFPETILALFTYEDALIVGGESYCKAVIGDIWDKDTSIDNTEIRDISKFVGPLSNEAIVECFSSDGNVLVFPTIDGVRYLTPGLQENSLRSIPLSEDIEPLYRAIVNHHNMAAAFDKGRLIISFTYYGEGSPVETNNTLAVCDMRPQHKPWCPPWEIPASGFCIANGKVYFGSPTEGAIYEFEKGTSDAGQPIHSLAKLGPDSTPYGAHKNKRFKRLRLVKREGSNTSNLNITVDVDGQTQTIAIGDNWNGKLTSPKSAGQITVGKGYQYSVTLEDNSTNDWVIPEIITEYIPGT